MNKLSENVASVTVAGHSMQIEAYAHLTKCSIYSYDTETELQCLPPLQHREKVSLVTRYKATYNMLPVFI